MRSTAAILQRATHGGAGQWKYVHSPVQFGRYPVLEPWMSMTQYPDIRPVPESIPRPPYVPTNFFTDDWGDHLPGSDFKFEEKLGKDGENGVRKAGKVVAELLKEVGRIIKVRSANKLLILALLTTLFSPGSPRTILTRLYMMLSCPRGHTLHLWVTRCSPAAVPLPSITSLPVSLSALE